MSVNSSHHKTAADLVLGDRNASYGHPRDDYAKTAKIWSGMLIHHLRPGVEITPEQAILMMAALKMSRLMHKYKDDSVIDVHGYMMCYDWVVTDKKPEA